jgi:hypothetical protein
MTAQPTDATTDAVTAERTVGQLVVQAQREMSALVHGEVELLKAELRISARNAGVGGGLLGGAGFLGVVAFILLSIAAAYGLVAAGLHPALAFVVVAVVYLLLAGALALVALRALRRVSGPERTARTLAQARTALRRGGS